MNIEKINEKDYLGYTPLQNACLENNLLMVNFLLQRKDLDLSIINFKYDDCPWIISARNKRFSICKSILAIESLRPSFNKSINNLLNYFLMSNNVNAVSFIMGYLSPLIKFDNNFLFDSLNITSSDEDLIKIYSSLPGFVSLDIYDRRGNSLISIIWLNGKHNLMDHLLNVGRFNEKIILQKLENVGTVLKLVKSSITPIQINIIMNKIMEFIPISQILYHVVSENNKYFFDFLIKNHKFTSTQLTSAFNLFYRLSKNHSIQKELLSMDEVDVNSFHKSKTPLVVAIESKNDEIFTLL